MQITSLFKRLLLIVGLLAGSVSGMYSQNDDVSVTYHQAPQTHLDTSETNYKRDNILEKIAIGGTMGLQFGGYTYVEVSPDISYHFNKWLCAGVGGTYIFAKNNYYKKTDHIFGARVFVEGHFFNYIGLHVAYQAINYDDFRPQTLSDRMWSNNLSMGGGLYQRFGRGSAYVYVLYNISNQEEYNVLGNILFKAGFNIFLR